MSELLYSIENIFDTSRPTGCLQHHGCSAYLIPSYQRGYKWGSEVNQPAERLLYDLKQAWGTGKREYLLQAITVKRANLGEKLVLEIIDGQQRLTTLVILLHALGLAMNPSEAENATIGRLLYCIRNQGSTLEELLANWSQLFCSAEGKLNQVKFEDYKNCPELRNEAHQDHYYLKCTQLRCLSELGEHQTGFRIEPTQIREFRTFVLEMVKLMVNVVEEHVSGESVFGNLNQNRVLLTETELIKGLLLTRAARVEANPRARRYREILELRIRLGRKWEEMRAWANRKDVQSLFFPAKPYPDGILGLLGLVASRLQQGVSSGQLLEGARNALFEFFFQQQRFDRVFEELETCYARLRDWHEDIGVYNLLGYSLMHEAKRIDSLLECLDCGTHSELREWLLRKRKKILPDLDAEESSGLKYGDNNDNKQIVSALLALSVFSERPPVRFDFHAYQAESWSLEHIFPQTPFGKGAQLSEAQERAVYEILRKNEGNLLQAETVKNVEDISKEEEPSTRRERLTTLLERDPGLHGIGNLCLLNRETNSALGCRMFDDKRKKIQQLIAEGAFVPRHTYEVFSKMIVGESTTLDAWTKTDIDHHEAEIKRRVKSLRQENSHENRAI